MEHYNEAVACLAADVRSFYERKEGYRVFDCTIKSIELDSMLFSASEEKQPTLAFAVRCVCIRGAITVAPVSECLRH